MKRIFLLTVIMLGSSFGLAQEIANPHQKIRGECKDCHTTGGWHTVAFDHSKTAFALEYRHKDVRCVECHDIKDFELAESRCISCHTDIHQSDLGSACKMCHTERGWLMFNPLEIHQNTTNPVIGKHARFDCEACHISQQIGEYRNLQSQCISCHESEYLATTDPAHDSFGFPTRCDDCHQYLSWIPAGWQEHDNQYFPIFSGAHEGEWSSCADCHFDAGNYRNFSCLNCHEHSKSKMDGKHREVGGYVYNSRNCYNCHRNGGGGD